MPAKPPSHGVPASAGPVPTQRKFVLTDQPVLALATVHHARSLLPGHDEDDILALIEDGSLLYAWDIRGGDVSSPASREIRILPACIEHYRLTGGHRPFPKSDHQVEADLLFNLGSKTFTTSRRLALVLNCSSTHVINLIEARQLAVLPNTTWGTGPNGAALVTIESVKTFFSSRRIL